MMMYCKINAPNNTRHNEMKNKEINVIGRDESVIIVRAKRSDCNLVIGLDGVGEKGKAFACRTGHKVQFEIWLPMAIMTKCKFHSTTGDEGPRIGVDMEDRYETEYRGTCVI